MRTRRGICYTEIDNMCYQKRKTDGNFAGAPMITNRKRLKSSSGLPVVVHSGQCDFLDTLPNDIVLCILAKLGSTAGCAADFFGVLSTYDLKFEKNHTVVFEFDFITDCRQLYVCLTDARD